MNITIRLQMLNQKIDDYCRYERSSPNFERHLGELILQKEELEDKLNTKRKCKQNTILCGKMGKIYYLFIIAITMFLMLSIPVNAGWWSNLFKISSEEKQVISETKTVSNYEKGLHWETTARTKLCSAVGGCLSTAEAAAKKLTWTGSKEEMFIIFGGKATNKFINDNRLYKRWFADFKREPDFLEVKHVNGKITELTIIDAKTSPGAVRNAQDADFYDFCRRSRIKCSIQYVVPEAAVRQSNANFVCLAAPALALSGPVGWTINGLCFFAAS